MVWFLSNVHPGTTTFTYLLRAERPGLYHALPARAELMYDPKVKANSAESVVRIRAKGRARILPTATFGAIRNPSQRIRSVIPSGIT
jgi:hypothetical protein